MQFDSTEWPEYYRHLSELAQSEPRLVAQAAKWITQAEAVAVLTGAGISAESGVPTFRGAGGFWRHFRPEELATPERLLPRGSSKSILSRRS